MQFILEAMRLMKCTFLGCINQYLHSNLCCMNYESPGQDFVLKCSYSSEDMKTCSASFPNLFFSCCSRHPVDINNCELHVK